MSYDMDRFDGFFIPLKDRKRTNEQAKEIKNRILNENRKRNHDANDVDREILEMISNANTTPETR